MKKRHISIVSLHRIVPATTTALYIDVALEVAMFFDAAKCNVLMNANLRPLLGKTCYKWICTAKALHADTFCIKSTLSMYFSEAHMHFIPLPLFTTAPTAAPSLRLSKAAWSTLWVNNEQNCANKWPTTVQFPNLLNLVTFSANWHFKLARVLSILLQHSSLPGYGCCIQMIGEYSINDSVVVISQWVI